MDDQGTRSEKAPMTYFENAASRHDPRLDSPSEGQPDFARRSFANERDIRAATEFDPESVLHPEADADSAEPPDEREFARTHSEEAATALRGKGFEAIAVYVPIHFPRVRWGVYFNLPCFLGTCETIRSMLASASSPSTWASATTLTSRPASSAN